MNNQLPEANKETYIGDGVYVSFDGYGIALRNSSLTSTTIYFNPLHQAALGAWLKVYPKLLDQMRLQNWT